MSGKPINPRARADRDIDASVQHYLNEAGAQVAPGFVDALARAFDQIIRQPAAGSPRYAHELDLSGLRSWRMKRCPYLIFYVERADHADVWRVLLAQRDIPAWMREPEGA